MSRKVVAVILASGKGERLNQNIAKQFIKIAGKTIVEHTLDTFERHDGVDEIIIVINPDYRNTMEEILLKASYKKVTKLLNGGQTRRQSSSIGVNAVNDDAAKVLIHDAVRPFISAEIIQECIDALDKHHAVDVAIPATDTVLRVNDASCIASIPERKYMMQGQTPQAFRAGIIKRAHSLAESDRNENVTDDCGLILHYKLSEIFVVRGSTENIKITYLEDIVYADKLFQLRKIHHENRLTPERLEGKVLVVFGASRGIGKSIVEIAGLYGAKVHGFSRSDKVDVADYATVERALEQVSRLEGKIDYVVNTAAVLRMGKLETRDLADLHEEIAINYMGSVNVIKASVPHLKKTRGCILLFTSSSYTRGRALYSSYSSTKAAIVNLVQALAEELLPDAVRINTINPERTSTPMRWEAFGKEPEETLLQPDKVAISSLTTLLSDITGQVVYITRED